MLEQAMSHPYIDCGPFQRVLSLTQGLAEPLQAADKKLQIVFF